MSNYFSDSPDDHRRPPSAATGSFVWPILFLLGLAAVLAYWFWPHWRSGVDPNATPRAVTARGDLAEDEKATIALFKEASPSVVHINTSVRQRDIFSLDVQEIPQGTGSGFIWDAEGHVVTNYHVIHGASAAKVFLWDHSDYDARLVGVYPDKDLAVLLIDAPKTKLRPIPVGSSHDLQVGQKAFAIGNPFGLDQTLTMGIVSALGREIKSVTRHTIKNVIQTDAAINPGNSGGPLLDSAGRLIGVNTAIYSPSGASVGIGFAIPVDEVNRAVPQLIRSQKITRPGLGIVPAEDQLMRQLDVQGVLILSVRPGGPAAKAGLRPTRQTASGRVVLGDIIVAIDGNPVTSAEDLYNIMDEHKVGDTVTVTVLRQDERTDVQVQLAAVS